MKVNGWTLAVAFAIACLAPTRAHAGDPYFDFRIPKHHWSSWKAGGSAEADANDQNSSNRESSQGFQSLSLESAVAWGFDSDRLQHRLSFAVTSNAGHNRNTDTQRDTVFVANREDRRRSIRERVDLNAALRTYPWSVPIGFEFGARVLSQLDQEWDHNRIENTARGITGRSISSRGAGDAQLSAIGSVSLGYGRVRDASVVYEVELLERRMLATHVLVHELSPDARRKLAALFYAQPRFTFAHHRPDKYFWRDLEQLLKEDDSLAPGGLDAYSVFRVLEPTLAGVTFIRQTGFFVGPTLYTRAGRSQRHFEVAGSFEQLQADTVLATSSSSFEQDTHARQDDTQIGAGAEVHRPFGPRWQADAYSQAFYRDQTHLLSSMITGSVEWLVDDRWYARGLVTHAADWTGIRLDPSHPRWSTVARVDVTYFVEDALGVTLGLETRQDHVPGAYSRQSQLSLGFTYWISGLLDVPGVIAPERLLR